MDFYIVSNEYNNALREKDFRVGFIDYGEDALKLHIGVVFQINNYKYFVPISSPKTKHLNMREGKDFIKLYDIQAKRLLAVLNINNMIPVPDNCLTKLEYKDLERYRSFENETEKMNYVYLLQRELAIIRGKEEMISRNAERLYREKMVRPNSILSKRCCDFNLLEKVCDEWKK